MVMSGNSSENRRRSSQSSAEVASQDLTQSPTRADQGLGSLHPGQPPRKRSYDDDNNKGWLGQDDNDDSSRSGTDRIKRTRVRTGCMQCKRRRVRCDEEGHPAFDGKGVAGTCNACRRLGLQCEWETPGNGPLRRRKTKPKLNEDESMCRACRSGDLQCSKEIPQCGSCLINNTACIYGDDAFLLPPHLSNSSQPITRYQALVGRIGNTRLVKTLVEAFFVEVYPCTIFAFLHPSTFVDAVDNQTAPVSLVLAVCALSAKFILDDVKATAQWITDAKRMAYEAVQLGSLTTYTLATLILCFHYELYTRDFVAAWVTSGNAIRMAFALRLNLDVKDTGGLKSLSFMEMETRRRLMWAVYVMDMYVSDGFGEYTGIPWTAMRIPLPCNQAEFELGLGVEADHLSIPTPGSEGDWTPPQLSLSTLSSPSVQYILVFSIRTKILRYVRHLAGDNSRPWEPNSTYASHHKLLKWWRGILPKELEIENRTTPFPVQSAQITAMFSLHLWHLISYCDLSRIFLFSFAEAAKPEVLSAAPLSFIQTAQAECVEYAGKLLRLCDVVLLHCPTFVSRDPYISVCFYQAIRITLWDLFRHPSPSTEMKRSVTSLARAALTHLYAMSDLFPFSACIMKDSFKILHRYGLSGYVAEVLPPKIFAQFSKTCQEALLPSQRTTLKKRIEQDESLSPLTGPNSPVTLAFDRAATDLLRPPFHSRKDTRLTLEISDESSSGPDLDHIPSSSESFPTLTDTMAHGFTTGDLGVPDVGAGFPDLPNSFPGVSMSSFQPAPDDNGMRMPFDLDLSFDDPNPLTRAFFDGSFWSLGGDLDSFVQGSESGEHQL